MFFTLSWYVSIINHYQYQGKCCSQLECHFREGLCNIGNVLNRLSKLWSVTIQLTHAFIQYSFHQPVKNSREFG